MLVCFQGMPFSITEIQVYAPTTNAKEAEVEQFYKDLQVRIELTHTHTHKCPFHHRGLECKGRKSRDTWSNRQVWPFSTRWSRGKANRVLPKNMLVTANTLFPTTQEMTLHMDITRYWNQIDYILCSQRWRGSIQSAKTRLGADCGSGHELLTAKFRLNWRKSGKPLDHSSMT